MTVSPSRSERLARNAALTVIARGAALCAIPLLGWNVKTLVDLQAAIQRIPDQILVVETRLAGRIGTVEDRVGAQSRRADSQDQRIERLERPYFEPRRGNP
jgi:hypothetical protein